MPNLQIAPEQRIDEALDSVLRASGSSLKRYTEPKTLANMREAMRKVMTKSYITGSNDSFDAMKKSAAKYSAQVFQK